MTAEFRRLLHLGVAAGSAIAGALSWTAAPVSAQQVAIRRYSQSDGLPQTQITALHQDSKGYLWIGTYEGLSRFDGYRFVNYGTKEGLGHFLINTIAEDRHKRLWVGTNGGGLARLRDESDISSAATAASPAIRSASSPKPFEWIRVGDEPNADNVNAIAFDADDTLWCATDAGLYRARNIGTARVEFERVFEDSTGLSRVLRDSRGRLWVGKMLGGVLEVVDGRPVLQAGPPAQSESRLIDITEDRLGRIRVANRRHLFELIEASGRAPRRWQELPLALEPSQEINSLHVDRHDTLWLGTALGLVKYMNGKANPLAAGGVGRETGAILHDREGNLWVGGADGLAQLVLDRVVNYTAAEGLSNDNVLSVMEDQHGGIYVTATTGELFEIIEDRARPVEGWRTQPFAAHGRWLLPSQRDGWWVLTGEGLYNLRSPVLRTGTNWKRFPASSISSEDLVDETPGNLPVLFDDGKGWIWLATRDGLHRFRSDAEPPRFERVSKLPTGTVPTVSAADRAGGLWLGSHIHLARFKDGEIVYMQPSDGLPETRPRAIFVDSRGWVWIGLRSAGVSVTRNPGAQSPGFTNYSSSTGLASDTVWAITEDEFGRMYFGTSRGFERLDVTTSQLRHLTTADGLAGNQVMDCLKDRAGRIWIATSTGLSRLDPRVERATAAGLSIFISRVQVAGEDVALPETGLRQLRPLRVEASRNNLLIEFVSPGFRGPGGLKYQYRLDSVDRDWSAPTEQRVVNYARLAPGSYEFRVRPIDGDGEIGAEVASVAFHILPPIWLRGWFLALIVCSLAAMGVAAHRIRLRQVLAMERIRGQMATDLHDDIGSGLSQVAILSEVLKRRAGSADTTTLTEIATLARDMRRSMSDIVWAVDPRRDRLTDVVQRMRKVAFNALEAAGITVEFNGPGRDIERFVVAPDRRRHLLLMFQEAITNIARHARASRVSIDLRVARNALELTVSDDGCGFDPSANRTGQGLPNLGKRVEQVRGRLLVESTPGAGTIVHVTMPLR